MREMARPAAPPTPSWRPRYRGRARALPGRRGSWGRAGDRRDVSAGGMPNRVKCLHALVAHALAAGPGVNPLGDEARRRVRGLVGRRALRRRRRSRDAMTRVAAIDCGTNSIRLLVADLDVAAGTLTDLLRRMEIVRLGQGVDRTGRLAPEAIERTRGRARRVRRRCRASSAPSGSGWSPPAPTRDAANRDDFERWCRRRSASSPRSSPGDEEAELSFVGATREPPRRRPTARRRSSSSTSAAARPSWCSATPAATAARSQWTSAACG